MVSKGKEGLHVGRPHSSKSDPKVHVTITQRNSDGKVTQKDHSSTLGGIAIGQALWENQSKK